MKRLSVFAAVAIPAAIAGGSFFSNNKPAVAVAPSPPPVVAPTPELKFSDVCPASSDSQDLFSTFNGTDLIANDPLRRGLEIQQKQMLQSACNLVRDFAIMEAKKYHITFRDNFENALRTFNKGDFQSATENLVQMKDWIAKAGLDFENDADLAKVTGADATEVREILNAFDALLETILEHEADKSPGMVAGVSANGAALG